MRAMVLHAAREPLRLEELPVPEAGPGQVRLRVSTCAVCRTDLHIVDGELPKPKLPLVIGHQIVGRTEDGRRLGIPWLGWTDGTCRYCLSGRENLCETGAVHGLRPRRRLRRVGRRRRALLPADSRGVRRPAGCAAPLCRTDRLPVAAARGRPRAAGALRLRLVCAHRRPGRAPRGTARVRLRPARGRRRQPPSRSSSAASGRARRTSPARRSSTRRSSSRRSARSCRRRCARRPVAASSSAPAST